MTTPKLQLPELIVGQAGKELTHNQALAILDQLTQPTVVDKDLAAPPGSPANGAMYIVAAAATGAWSGQSGNLAVWLTTVGAWTFITPANGWSVWVIDEAKRYERVSGAWVIFAAGGGGVSLPVVQALSSSRSLSLADVNTFNVNSTASNYSVTIPMQTTVAWEDNTEINFLPSSTGHITITCAAGVSLNGTVSGSLTLSTKNGTAMIKRIGVDSWWVGGSSVMTVVPAPNAYWDAGRKGSIVTLSESDMAAARTGGSNGSGNSFVATAKGVSAGKFYLEIVLSSYNPDGATGAFFAPTVGVISDTSATALASLGTVTGLDGATANQRAYYQRNGNAAYGATTFSMPAMSVGARWRIAVDATAKRVWFGSAEGWNGDPETGVGGGDISAFNGDIYICFAGYNTSNAPDGVTLKVSDGDFMHSKPGGFVSFETV